MPSKALQPRWEVRPTLLSFLATVLAWLVKEIPASISTPRMEMEPRSGSILPSSCIIGAGRLGEVLPGGDEQHLGFSGAGVIC